ncbi:PaaI family thioesterase [Nocardioides pacificus]
MRLTVEDLDPVRRERHEALVSAVRDLNLAAGTTLIDAPDLDEVTAAVTELSRVLSKERTPRVVRSTFTEPSRRARAGLPLDLNAVNPTLLGVRVEFGHDADTEADPETGTMAGGAAGLVQALDGGDPVGMTARAELTVDALHEGPPDSVHGGVTAFLMDCLLGILVQATGIPSVTGTLDLRYLRRTPLEEPVVLVARLVRHEGRKLWAEGWIEHEGQRTVEAHGLFISVAPRQS